MRLPRETLLTRFNKIYRVTRGEPFEVREIFSLLDYLPQLVSPSLLPDEWVDGRGDGLVAGVRGKLHWIPSHDQKEFPVNHASVLIDQKVRELILERLEELR